MDHSLHASTYNDDHEKVYYDNKQKPKNNFFENIKWKCGADKYTEFYNQYSSQPAHNIGPK